VTATSPDFPVRIVILDYDDNVIASAASPLTFSVPRSTTYYIAIMAGRRGDIGSYNVKIACASQPPPPPPCEPVSITLSPSDQRIAAGTSASLQVGVSGTPPFEYIWQEDYPTQRIVGSNNSFFVTPPLYVQTAYHVEVRNACGSTFSSRATIQIIHQRKRPVKR
jgi:hypothetical protein